MTASLSIYVNSQAKSQAIQQELLRLLAESPLQVVEPGQAADFILSIGGDGTFLSTFHRCQAALARSIFVGIHTGHLGFYTDWQSYELEELVHRLENFDGQTVSYPLLTAEVSYIDGRKDRLLALNECSLKSQQGTMVCDVILDGEYFETFRGDGICVATPTGSTGLNKSLGGAVVHPSLSAIQMTEIASINNVLYRTLSSPIIVPEGREIELVVVDQDTRYQLVYDHLWQHDVAIEGIRFRVADERIHFAEIKHLPYWKRVEQTFIGGHPGHPRS